MSALPLNETWLRLVWHTENYKEERKRKERPFSHECDWVRNTLEWRAEAERVIRPFLCVSSRESKTQKRESFSWEVEFEKIERKTQWECERVKKKNVTFFFTQITHKEVKLVEFSWSFWELQPWRVGVFKGRFCYWLCNEIVFTPWDLFVVYPIYCGLKFCINLIGVISIS